MRVESVEVPKIVNYFLQKSFFDGSSDIHIEPTEDFLLVRNRVDGILHELTTLPASMHPEIVSRISSTPSFFPALFSRFPVLVYEDKHGDASSFGKSACSSSEVLIRP